MRAPNRKDRGCDALMESQARNRPPFIVVANEFENPPQEMPVFAADRSVNYVLVHYSEGPGSSRARRECTPPISSLRGMTLPCQCRGDRILAHSVSEMSFSTKVSLVAYLETELSLWRDVAGCGENWAFSPSEFGVLCSEHVCWPPILGVRSKQKLGLEHEGLSAAHARANRTKST